MRHNIGYGGRVIRVAIGVLLLGLYGALTPPWKYLTLIGLVPLGTGLTGFCPLVAAIRGRTRPDARSAP
jgi:hypothetical protein